MNALHQTAYEPQGLPMFPTLHPIGRGRRHLLDKIDRSVRVRDDGEVVHVKRKDIRGIILAEIQRTDKNRTVDDVATVTGTHPTTVIRYIRLLEKEGHVESEITVCGCARKLSVWRK